MIPHSDSFFRKQFMYYHSGYIIVFHVTIQVADLYAGCSLLYLIREIQRLVTRSIIGLTGEREGVTLRKAILLSFSEGSITSMRNHEYISTSKLPHGRTR